MVGSVAATWLRSASRLSSLFGQTNPLIIRFSFSNSALRQAPAPSPFRLRRRSAVFLISLIPIHTAIASASLVSKLPTQLAAFTQGRFTYYVSPIQGKIGSRILMLGMPRGGGLVGGMGVLGTASSFSW